MRIRCIIRYYPRVSEVIPNPKASYLRVTHPFAGLLGTPKSTFLPDLHVLSTPPAFVLSQDQTLRCLISLLLIFQKHNGRLEPCTLFLSKNEKNCPNLLAYFGMGKRKYILSAVKSQAFFKIIDYFKLCLIMPQKSGCNLEL